MATSSTITARLGKINGGSGIGDHGVELDALESLAQIRHQLGITHGLAETRMVEMNEMKGVKIGGSHEPGSDPVIDACEELPCPGDILGPGGKQQHILFGGLAGFPTVGGEARGQKPEEKEAKPWTMAAIRQQD